MGRWLWKIAEVLSAVVMGIFILVPSRMENEFFSNLYAEKPVLCIELLAASGVLIPTFIHAIVEQRRKKARKTQRQTAARCDGRNKREEKC